MERSVTLKSGLTFALPDTINSLKAAARQRLAAEQAEDDRFAAEREAKAQSYWSACLAAFRAAYPALADFVVDEMPVTMLKQLNDSHQIVSLTIQIPAHTPIQGEWWGKGVDCWEARPALRGSIWHVVTHYDWSDEEPFCAASNGAWFEEIGRALLAAEAAETRRVEAVAEGQRRARNRTPLKAHVAAPPSPLDRLDKALREYVYSLLPEDA